jgi:hypothetical protein
MRPTSPELEPVYGLRPSLRPSTTTRHFMKHSVQAPGYPGAAHTSGKHRPEHDTPIAFAAAPVGVIVFAQRLTVHAHVLLQAAVPAGHWHMRTKCANRGDRNSEIRSNGFGYPRISSQ